MHDLLVALVSVAAGIVAPPFWRWVLRQLRGTIEAQRETGELERLSARAADLEELVDLLRRALDKHMIRESAIAAAAELLIAIVGMVHDPSGPMRHLRDRAQRLLEDARAHTLKINEGTLR